MEAETSDASSTSSNRSIARNQFRTLLSDVHATSAALRVFMRAATDKQGHSEQSGQALGELMTLLAEWMDSISSILATDDPPADTGICSGAAQAGRSLREDIVWAAATKVDGGYPASRGGLAPWQVRRVTLHIESHIDAEIRISDLACICRLSTSHFIRAFRASYGDSPHCFIMKRRTERAQGLMLTTTAPLGQIAQECGLSDQSHLTRLFQRFVGESPGTWRRARSLPGSDSSP
jgi:AraC-like DNA-binding protein